MSRFGIALFTICVLLPSSPSAIADPFADDLAAIVAVDLHGGGHEQAQQAYRRLLRAGPERLTDILSVIDRGGPLASNWLRAAVDTIAERTLDQGGELPVDQLYAYLNDRDNGARSRRLAFEWIVHIQPEARQRLLETMLDDSSLELRYDAVASVIEKADAASPEVKKRLYREAIAKSRDIDQIEKCVSVLEEEGESFDVVGHLGLITRWYLIGPFDNTGRSGLLKPYPPEQGIDLEATYDGKEGTVAWRIHQTEENRGIVDFNEAIGKHNGAVAYAYTEIQFPEARPAQLRIGCINAHRVWLNDELVDTNDVYHAGMSIDQYISDVRLKAGRNRLLVKVCQNEQTESWAQRWQFQLRITDALGGGLQGEVILAE